MAAPDNEALQAAEAKWLKHLSDDPEPTVAKSLLAADHIKLYAEKAGLLHPFYGESDRLKAASYEVRLGDTLIYWNDEGEKKIQTIDKNSLITLPANSICFVTLESQFLLPRYIAARFNLRIKHVHRGLLVGTGPLVDPGFRGHLLIPLHNLTVEPYTIRGDEGLIWVEFTKTSFKPETDDSGTIKALGDWEKRKNNQSPAYYFEKANQNRPIRSSIPEAIRETKGLSERAQKSAAEASAAAGSAARTNRLVGLAFVGSITAAVITLLSFFEQIKGNVISAVTLASTVGTTAERAADEAKAALGATDNLKVQLDKLLVSSDEIHLLRTELEQVTVRVEALMKQNNDLRDEVRTLEGASRKTSK